MSTPTPDGRAPKVSIGVSFYNCERTLTDTLRSVFAQTYTDWELILVDDGSRDGSLRIARSVADERVRVLADGVNRGLVERLNQINALARGQYVARLDGDDLMHPERLARQVEFLDRHREVDLVGSAVCTIDENSEPWGMRGEAPLNVSPAAVLCRGLVVHPTALGRTEWFRRNPYDPEYVRAEDRELWCRTCRTSTFARLPEQLLFYREGLAGNLDNYLRSYRTERKILRTYGPAAVGYGRTLLLLARTHFKGFAYRVCDSLGLQGRVIRRRNRPLLPGAAAEARAVIGRILRTPVPGLTAACPALA